MLICASLSRIEIPSPQPLSVRSYRRRSQRPSTSHRGSCPRFCIATFAHPISPLAGPPRIGRPRADPGSKHLAGSAWQRAERHRESSPPLPRLTRPEWPAGVHSLKVEKVTKCYVIMRLLVNRYTNRRHFFTRILECSQSDIPVSNRI